MFAKLWATASKHVPRASLGSGDSSSRAIVEDDDTFPQPTPQADQGPEELHPLALKAGETIVMEAYHTIFGAQRRYYTFIGYAQLRSDKSAVYPLFCTHQTSGGKGPDPNSCRATWFRKVLSVPTGNDKGDGKAFLNLAQFAVLHPPTSGRIPAERSDLFLCTRAWESFRHGLIHLTTYHPQLYTRLCAINTIGDEDHTVIAANSGLIVSMETLAKEALESAKDCMENCSLITDLHNADSAFNWEENVWSQFRKKSQKLTYTECRQMYGTVYPADPSKYVLYVDLPESIPGPFSNQR